MYSTLISATELASHLDAPDWVIVDCRFDLARPESGREAYTNGHIPGARYAHLDEHLSSPVTPHTGRHPLPDPERLAATLGTWGIAETTQVVAYDAGNGACAARLWWLLRWLGAARVAVLDGGFKAWTDLDLPVTAAVPAPRPARFVARPRAESVLAAPEVLAKAHAPDWRILDARAPERFSGSVEPLDTVAGHVPGARNHPFTDNLAADGRFLSPQELKAKFEQALVDVPPAHAIMMCGSGVTACHNLLALEIAGLPGGRLYAGSWSEWIRDPSRPVATGV